MKNREEFSVVLTDPILEVLDQMQRLYGHPEWVFYSSRGSTPHINPYSINQHFIKTGYKGLQTAHGFRRTAGTVGQDILGFDWEVIDRCLAHAFGDKVRSSYDDSTLLDERRKFMTAWCDALVAQGLKI